MAWIESHEDLLNHPKTTELMTALNADLPTTVGVLHLLWHFTMKFAWRDGNLIKYTPNSISRFIGWTGEPKKLIEALQSTGWLDDMQVHDWLHYAGKIASDRIYNENRKRRITPLNVETQPLPNRTVPNITKEHTQSVSEFISYFNLKTGKKLRITPARRRIIDARLKDFSIDQLKIAVDNFAKDDWADRHKYTDVVYCIGIRNQIDNLDKWLNAKPKEAAWVRP